MQTIQTTKGKYNFKHLNLFRGRKKINKNLARKNLLVIRDILEKTDIRWGLIFGTLLGAIREKNFIKHDEDVDIYIFKEDEQKLIDLLWELKNRGFNVVRFANNSLLSIVRNNEYIDFYLFRKTLFGRRCLNYYVPGVYFSSHEIIDLFNKKFPTLSKPREYLVFQYGKDWETPKKNCYAEENIWWKEIVKKNMPALVKTYHLWKKN